MSGEIEERTDSGGGDKMAFGQQISGKYSVSHSIVGIVSKNGRSLMPACLFAYRLQTLFTRVE